MEDDCVYPSCPDIFKKLNSTSGLYLVEKKEVRIKYGDRLGWILLVFAT